MIYPAQSTAPLPHPDLPAHIVPDFLEAREIVNLSPRGAAALLRLVIRKLCKELGGEGKNINDDIGKLVKDGLPVRMQKALDAVRVIGNNAVHPGELDLKDDARTASKLFKLVNLIVDDRITQPKEIDELFDMIPEDKKKGIADRDGKAKSVGKVVRAKPSRNARIPV